MFDHSGMTETGPMTFECLEAPGGIHVSKVSYRRSHRFRKRASNFRGQIGELVVPTWAMGHAAHRYRTGDQVRLTRRHTAPAAAPLPARGGSLAGS